MDDDHFDALSRSLSTTPSRRGALRLLAGSALGSLLSLSALSTEAKKKKKKKKKRKKRRCTPSCGGKTCGDDGCGGSCGPCNGGTCEGGVCRCSTGEDVCNGACVPTCDPAVQVRPPGSCACCVRNGISIVDGPCPSEPVECCSVRCEDGQCAGRSANADCAFDEQCQSGKCELVPAGDFFAWKCVP